MTPPAIHLRDLNKIFPGRHGQPDTVAVRHLSLDIHPGEIFGLLGPNGAGKTTTIGMIVGAVVRTSGEVKVFGHDVEKDYKITRAMIGVVPQEVNFDPFTNVRRCLEFQSGLFGVAKKDWWIDELLERLHLLEHARKNVRQLSGGMRRRLLIAKALVHKPRILILDEPTAGVDIELRRSLWEFVAELKKNGTTIILTTHYLEEAERHADRFAIIDRGEIKGEGTLEQLKNQFGKQSLEHVYFKLVHNEELT